MGTALVLLVLMSACVSAHENLTQDQHFFLKQIFNKYGDKGVISFEGFEHLLENLGLGRLVFEKSHNLSLHKVNGSFQEVHDSLHLHEHSHEDSKTRRRRHTQDNGEELSYAEPEGRSRCLTPQDLLHTFGLESDHKAIISQRLFLEICPAIIYELDQRSCYDDTDDAGFPPEHIIDVAPHSVWLYASLSVLVISLIGLLGVAMVPLVQRTFFQQLLHFLVALAVGTMSGDALLHLLPHALMSDSDAKGPVLRAFVTFLAIGFFFLLESLLHSVNRKSHEGHVPRETAKTETKPLNEMLRDYDCDVHVQTTPVSSVAWMVIMGDGLHNLTDGLAIGAAFSGDIVAGFATALAVLCHELPHELGDFAVLLQAGMSIRSAITYNIISSVLSFMGMAIGVCLGEYHSASLWIYAFTAGTFLYISLVDLIPEMNSQNENSRSFLNITLQVGGILMGAGIMLVIAIYEDALSSIFS